MTQPIYAVTLATLREHRACYEGYNKVVRMLQGEPFSKDDEERWSYIKLSHAEPVSLVTIAQNNCLDDALWTLRCIPGCDRDARLFAVWCARQVEHLMTDQRSKDALDVAERFANGEATDEELAAARAATWAATWATTRAATWATTRAATRAAAEAAACAVACAVAEAAACAVARAVAEAAACAVARAAAEAAACAVARAARLEMFIAMCEGRAPWQTKTAALCG